MFQLFKKKEAAGISLAAPIKGKAVSMETVNDPTFSALMLGNGAAIIPEDGKLYAPADGTIDLVFDTLHALSMTSTDGVEILIHIGLDTVKLAGKGFTPHVKNGQAVKKGDLLFTIDLDTIKAAGYDTIIPVVICNTDNYSDVKKIADGPVAVGDDFIKIVF